MAPENKQQSSINTRAASPMDTPLASAPKRKWLISVAALVLLVGATVAWRTLPGIAEKSQTIALDRVSFATVSRGTFDDFIPLRATVAPLNTVFLDAIEGGRVEKRFVEDGAAVSAGQPLVALTNSAMQLEVIRSESEVTNQLNNLRSIEIQLARNRVENARALTEIGWQLERIEQKHERERLLASKGFLSAAGVKDTFDEANYWRQRLRIASEGQRADERLQEAQVKQLSDATRQLQANLLLARANLDALTVRAPVAGQLTAFEINVGQSLTRGQRIGQIDGQDAFKLVVNVDEHYLSRIAIGQSAALDLEGTRYDLAVRKINPQVRSGQFEVELVFKSAPPNALRRGQSLQIRLSLGESRPALLLPNAAFLADGGGNYAFVVEGDPAAAAKTAIKRAVKLGRRNASFVEVESGLREGEKVLTSSYAALLDKERLNFSQ
jgi:HlyD family secretion protein